MNHSVKYFQRYTSKYLNGKTTENLTEIDKLHLFFCLGGLSALTTALHSGHKDYIGLHLLAAVFSMKIQEP